MAGRFIFGFVFDTRPVRRRRAYLYTAVAASFGAVAALMATVSGYVWLAAITCLVAVLEGGAHSQRATSVNELVQPSQASLGVGLVIFAQGFGNFYGPIVGGKFGCCILPNTAYGIGTYFEGGTSSRT